MYENKRDFIIISSVPPIALAAAKAFVGAITLAFIYILFSKKEQNPNSLRYPRKRLMLLYAGIAFFEAVIPFFLIGWGQQRVSSSMASIIMGTVPIFTLLILFLFKVSRLRLMHFISIGVGFVGILLIILPSLTIDITNQSLWGMAALIFASIKLCDFFGPD